MSDRSGDIDRLDAYLKELGADDADIAAATRVGGLGPLALDLVLRPPGEVLSLDQPSPSESFRLTRGSRLDRDLFTPAVLLPVVLDRCVLLSWAS